MVYFDRGGTCTIEAAQAGNSEFLAGAGSQSIDVVGSPPPAPAPAPALRVSTSVTNTAITTTFTATGPGKVTQVGTTPTGKGSRSTTIKVCTTTKTVKKAGKVTLTCTLTNAAKAMRRKGSQDVLLTTTFTPKSGPKAVSTKTIKLGRK
jgi:hypothetical protein